jgi:ribosomal protein L11
MGINTRKVSHSFNDKGGKAEIEYVVDMQHTVFTKNKFTIQVKQDGGRSNA